MFKVLYLITRYLALVDVTILVYRQCNLFPLSWTCTHRLSTEDLAFNMSAKNCAIAFAAFGCEFLLSLDCKPDAKGLGMFTTGFILGERKFFTPMV